MKKIITTVALMSTLIVFSQETNQKQKIYFKENKGQVSDQNYLPRPDVLFYGNANGLNYYLTNNGISYQIEKVTTWEEVYSVKTNKPYKTPKFSEIYRTDIKWVNANTNSIIEKGKALDGEENYYLEHCMNGVLGVKSYDIVNYKEIYNGIDLKWYEKSNTLEYDFVVKPFADYSQIKLEINGVEKIAINNKGELVLETPLGKIIEKAPKTYQGNKIIASKWKINKKIASFEIGEYDHAKTLIIDPVIRNWGTFYGGINYDNSADVENDIFNNVFITGNTNSTGAIATSGAHSTTLTGNPNAFLVKFNSQGVRQWATYYGGNGGEYGLSCSTNGASADVFIVGYTSASTGSTLATAAAHQTVSGGGEDCFLVKFNSLGVRQWATYYGGVGNDRAFSCVNDISGNVYICGSSNSTTGTVIATSGSHQSINGGSYDAFLVKFNSSGIRQWGTYYGGTANSEIGYACAVDGSSNFVYMTGEANSTTANVIATTGSHQSTFGGIRDAFLVKFNSSGVRQWGTYYGGTGVDIGKSCVVDVANNNIIYVCGETNTPTSTVIATSASHQSSNGGAYDAFVVQFNQSGVRQWSTYYGGSGDEKSVSCFTDNSSNVYMAGSTQFSSPISIATLGSYQPTSGGPNDAYMVKFNSSGVRQWGTHYGDSGDEVATGACMDLVNNKNLIYIVGNTTTNTGTVMASGGSHQPNYGGGSYDAFLVQFFDCTLPAVPIDNTPLANLTMCENTGTTTLLSLGTGSLTWYNASTGGLAFAFGNSFVTPTLSAGVYSVYVEAVTCAPSPTRKEITFTVTSQPTLTIVSSSSIICTGSSATLNVSGALSYSWNTNITTNTITISPNVTTSYSVIGTDANGCTNSSTFSQIVSPCTSINNLNGAEELAIQIYPNPTFGNIVIETENSCDLTINNILGQIILVAKLQKGSTTININELPNGVYYFCLKTGNVITTKKIIKH